MHDGTQAPRGIFTLFDRRRSRLTRRAFLRGSSAVLGGMALSGLLAACGGDDDDDDDATATSPSGQTTPTTGGATPGTEATATTGGGATPGTDATATTGGGATPGADATATLAASPETGGEGTPGGDLIIAYQADPETLDPHITTALLAARTLAMMHDELVSRDYSGEYVPGLATEWAVSDDGLIYTFTLTEGVTFHSGKAFTSADVKYTYERWKTTEGSPTAYMIEPIDTIETPDDQTVVLNLSEPYNILLEPLSGGFGVILNQEAVEAAGESYGVETVDGTGPFVFESWTRNQSLNMTRFDAYTWGSPMFENAGPAYVDSVEIRVIPEANTRIAEFQSGNIHIVQDVPPVEVERLASADGVEIIEYAQLQTTYLGMNTSKAPTDDLAVRQAIAYGIDREAVVEGANFGLGTPALTMLHPETPYFSQEALDAAPSYDPDMARQILDEAGWVGDDVREKDGVQLIIPLWIINDETTVLQAQIIQEQLADIGIQVEPQQYEQTAWFEAARSGEQVGYIIGVFFSSADVLYFYFHSVQQPAPNRFFYTNPEVDAWLEDSRSNPDDAAVAEDYANIQMALVEDVPCAPLIHGLGTLGKLENVQGVQVHASRWLYRLLDIWIEE